MFNCNIKRKMWYILCIVQLFRFSDNFLLLNKTKQSKSKHIVFFSFSFYSKHRKVFVFNRPGRKYVKQSHVLLNAASLQKSSNRYDKLTIIHYYYYYFVRSIFSKVIPRRHLRGSANCKHILSHGHHVALYLRVVIVRDQRINYYTIYYCIVHIMFCQVASQTYCLKTWCTRYHAYTFRRRVTSWNNI